MHTRLRELVVESLAQRGARLAQKCEQALAMATLASFLSYISCGAPVALRTPRKCMNSSGAPPDAPRWHGLFRADNSRGQSSCLYNITVSLSASCRK